MELALIEFERAVMLDPAFASAYVGLAQTYLHLAGYGHRNFADVKAQAETAIAEALGLQSNLAEAHAAKYRLLNAMEADWAEQQKWLKQAIALNPNNAQAHIWLANESRQYGRPANEVLPLNERAYAIDPLAPNIVHSLAHNLYAVGQNDRALALVEELAVLDLARSYRARGIWQPTMDVWTSPSAGSLVQFSSGQTSRQCM